MGPDDRHVNRQTATNLHCLPLRSHCFSVPRRPKINADYLWDFYTCISLTLSPPRCIVLNRYSTLWLTLLPNYSRCLFRPALFDGPNHLRSTYLKLKGIIEYN